MTKLQEKLKKWCPPHYIPVWNENPNEPVRFKISNHEISIKTLNMVWAEVLSEMTNSKYIDNGDYIRVHTNSGKQTIAISIYPSGTVMFQGTAVHAWLTKYVIQICKKVTKLINKPGLFLNNPDPLDKISKKEITIFGLCMVCNKADNDEMLQCEDTRCRTWIHNRCENLTEDEARNKSSYLCPNCRKDPQLESTVPKKWPTSSFKEIPAPPPTQLDLEISSDSEITFPSDTSSLSQRQVQPLDITDGTLIAQCGIQKGFKNLSVSLPIQILEKSKNVSGIAKSQSLISKSPIDSMIMSPPRPATPLSVKKSLTKTEHIVCHATSTPRNRSCKSLFTGNTSSIQAENSSVDPINDNFICRGEVDINLPPVQSLNHEEGRRSLNEISGNPFFHGDDANVDSTPQQQSGSLGGGESQNVFLRDPFSPATSDLVHYCSDTVVPPKVIEEKTKNTNNLTKYLQERVCKLLEENILNKNQMNDQTINQQKLQMQIDDLSEQIRHKDEIICSIYKSNHEEDRIKYFQNMDPEVLIKKHIKLQNMYHTLKSLYDDAVQCKDSIKQQLNEEKRNQTMNEEQVIKYEELLKKFEKLKAEQVTKSQQQSELIQNLKKQRMEIQLLEMVCKKYELQQESKDTSEESIVEAPKTFIYIDEESIEEVEVEAPNTFIYNNEESIQEVATPDIIISETKIQNSRTFYRKDFDPRVFEQRRNMYKTFLKLVKEEENVSKTPVSPEVNLVGTTVPPPKNETLKNQYFTKTSRTLKNHSNVCWYDLNNICKFGKNCRNRHVPNSRKENYKNNLNQQTTNTINPTRKYIRKVAKLRQPAPENKYNRNNQNIQNRSLYNGYEFNLQTENCETGESGSQSQTLGVTGYHSVPYCGGEVESGKGFLYHRRSSENDERGIQF